MTAPFRDVGRKCAVKKRILVIDDEPEITHLVKLGLESVGRYIVCEETVSARAVETARRFCPDVIVLDIMMPDPDGSELAKTLREDPELGRIPLLFLTALISETQSGDSGQGVDRRHYLAKPVALLELAQFIERCTPTGPFIGSG